MSPIKCSCYSIELLARAKIQTNIFMSSETFILAIWINPIIICFGFIFNIYIKYDSNNSGSLWVALYIF